MGTRLLEGGFDAPALHKPQNDAQRIRRWVGAQKCSRLVRACQITFYQINSLRFLLGDAEALPFDSQSFDVVINIESSYGYGHIERFFREALRVLRPGGYFLYADYRRSEQMTLLRQHLLDTGFTVLTDERISDQVVKVRVLVSGAKCLNPLPRLIYGM